ncbi:NAD(P)-binding protein [Lentinula aciculospora]|uniref:NAD(P)-binding protein n=1 Tax=Lentinula aciculospora TaxID=153920 RepID=A0A9W8ZWK1_9AGAR|nr:NAD(P)-binding protein [Lentinula aciculospora]
MSWSLSAASVLAAFILIATLYIYIRANDRKLHSIPARALKISPKRVTEEDVEELKEQMHEQSATDAGAVISRKTGRRYIVVGGAGFLGGWIVIQLLQRGEDPKNIRVLDIRLPARHDLKYGIGKDVDYLVVDISDREAVQNAFRKPWLVVAASSGSAYIPLTIFHTAANIRFYERSLSLFHYSTKVNVDGTQNVIDAALEIDAFGASLSSASSINTSSYSTDSTVLIYTSSGSVAVRATRFLLWPWENEPENFVQNLDDNDVLLPTEHKQFFSNYAHSKYLAERRVRAADRSISPQSTRNYTLDSDFTSTLGTESNSRIPVRRLRTGCIRPGNGVFGPGGDMLCGAYLVRKTNPTWISNIVSHFVYVENCAAAHLCYERRLIDIEEQQGSSCSSTRTSNLPDIGGQAFTIADPGLPPTYGDVYLTLETLTNGQTFFPELSPTLMLLIAYIIEFYYLGRAYLLSYHPLSSVSGNPFSKLASKLIFALGNLLPPMNKDLVNLQPSLFNLTMVHLIFDDSRARLDPELGGLSYRGKWNTIEGLWRTWDAHEKGVNLVNGVEGVNRSGTDIRSDGAGVSFGFGMIRAQRGVGKVVERVQKVEHAVEKVVGNL